MILTRRDTLLGSGAALLLAAAPSRAAPDASPEWAGLTARLKGGCLGVAAIDLASGRRLAHDAGGRYLFCSTFKLPLAAAILAEAAAGRLALDRRVPVSRADLLPHSPVTERLVGDGGATVRALCRAAMTVSDNAAANLLLGLIGGPAGLTRFFRRQGDAVSRLDHREPLLNRATPGSAADTTTPAAMLALTRRLLVGPALPGGARADLIEWMTRNDAGRDRLRAGLPPGWRAGSRTGTADGIANDLLIAWPPGGAAPVIAACYVDAPAADDAARLAVHAEVGRLVAALV